MKKRKETKRGLRAVIDRIGVIFHRHGQDWDFKEYVLAMLFYRFMSDWGRFESERLAFSAVSSDHRSEPLQVLLPEAFEALESASGQSDLFNALDFGSEKIGRAAHQLKGQPCERKCLSLTC